MMKKHLTYTTACLLACLVAAPAGGQVLSEFQTLNTPAGVSMSMSGGFLAVGSNSLPGGFGNQGAVDLYKWTPQQWAYVTTFSDPNGHTNQNFGAAVSIDNGILAVGAPGDNQLGPMELGAVFLYDTTNPPYSLIATLRPAVPSIGQRFGSSVDLSGGVLVATAPGDLTSGSGIAGSAHFIEQNIGGPNSWGTRNVIYPNYIDGLLACATNGVDVVLGSRGQAGAFRFNGTAWAFDQPIMASGPGSSYMGVALDLSGSSLIAGAVSGITPSGNNGHAFIFSRASGTWTQQANLERCDAPASDGGSFGISVQIDGASAFVGSPGHVVGGAANKGKAFQYAWVPASSSWDLVADYAPSPTTASSSGFGGILAFDQQCLAATEELPQAAHNIHLYEPCTESVTLTLNTDANGWHTAWAVFEVGSATPIYSGPDPCEDYGNSAFGPGFYRDHWTHYEEMCLSAGRDYRLVVFDSFSDGIVTTAMLPQPFEVAYRLDDQNGNPIIVANGAFSTCDSQITGNAGAPHFGRFQFRLPVGPVAVDSSTLNDTQYFYNPLDAIHMAPASAANHLVWIFDPHGGFSLQRQIALPLWDLGNFVSRTLVPTDVDLNVRFRELASTDGYGPATVFRIVSGNTQCGTTNLVDDDGSSLDSCDLTSVNAGSTIHAEPMLINGVAANFYQFRFVPAGQAAPILFQGSATTALTLGGAFNSTAPALRLQLGGFDYDVSVRARVGGGPFCDWGKVCTIVTAP